MSEVSIEQRVSYWKIVLGLGFVLCKKEQK